MCFIDDGNDCAVWNETEIKARKEHQCDSCGAPIAKGSVYVKHFSVFDGYVTSEKACSSCQAMRKQFADKHEGMMFSPSYFAQSLFNCISEGDEESESLWRPMLEEINARRTAAVST